MNQTRPNAWPYRDYVIRSFNEDKPYNQFIVEQLAGDALGADEATGFIVGGSWDQVKSPDANLTAQQRMDELHDMVSTTGSTFLGLTVGCARCHNHKFDPISQVTTRCKRSRWRPHGEDHAVRPRQPHGAQTYGGCATLDTQLPFRATRRSNIGWQPTHKPIARVYQRWRAEETKLVRLTMVMKQLARQGRASWVYQPGKPRNVALVSLGASSRHREPANSDSTNSSTQRR
jgi:hypothetical protein